MQAKARSAICNLQGRPRMQGARRWKQIPGADWVSSLGACFDLQRGLLPGRIGQESYRDCHQRKDAGQDDDAGYDYGRDRHRIRLGTLWHVFCHWFSPLSCDLVMTLGICPFQTIIQERELDAIGHVGDFEIGHLTNSKDHEDARYDRPSVDPRGNNPGTSEGCPPYSMPGEFTRLDASAALDRSGVSC
jgi:hypothetical protein